LITNIWAEVQGHIATRNVTFNMEDVKHSREEMFYGIGREDWKQLSEHMQKLENEYYDGDMHFDSAGDLIMVTERCGE
jgi:hypothetical protein